MLTTQHSVIGSAKLSLLFFFFYFRQANGVEHQILGILPFGCCIIDDLFNLLIYPFGNGKSLAVYNGQKDATIVPSFIHEFSDVFTCCA